MTKQELKHKLHSYRDLLAEYDQIKDELAKVEAFMEAPRGSNLDGMPRGGSSGDPIVNVVAHHIALQERYRTQLHRLAAAQAEIENLIDGLEPGERRLMRCRYIDGMTWEEVCVAMNYSWRQIHRIHAKALEMLKTREETTT
jgi:RNA polymerase sigma factor (sigma-70 family)